MIVARINVSFGMGHANEPASTGKIESAVQFWHYGRLLAEQLQQIRFLLRELHRMAGS
jgi:hypothetical protein